MTSPGSLAGSSPPCSACGGSMVPFFATRDYNRGITDKVFQYCRCPRCGMISLSNVPSDLGRYYATGYHSLPASVADVERGLEHERYKIDLVLRFATCGDLLEIGPSWGAFCLLAQRSGFRASAIEMDRACCDFLSEKLGIHAIHSIDPADAIENTPPQNVIALWHVAEHLRDPWVLLGKAAQQLVPGGVLVIAMPNPDSAQFKLFQRFWTHVDAPRHVHLIPPGLLRAEMQQLGLNEVFRTTNDPGGLGWNEFGWRMSASNLVNVRSLKRPMRLIGRILALIAAPFERPEGRGSTYTAVFRRPDVRPS